MAQPNTKIPVTVEKRRARRHAGEVPFEGLRRQVDHLFDDFQRGYWHLPFRRGVVDVEPFWRGEVAFGPLPAVDIIQTDAAYVVSAELPGVAEGDIDVKFCDGTLTITAEKLEETEAERGDYFLSERNYGSFKRSFRVSDGIDPDKIEARSKNGVLTVTLPKTADARRRTKTVAVKKT
jgi:HSP20 family protein